MLVNANHKGPTYKCTRQKASKERTCHHLATSFFLGWGMKFTFVQKLIEGFTLWDESRTLRYHCHLWLHFCLQVPNKQLFTQFWVCVFLCMTSAHCFLQTAVAQVLSQVLLNMGLCGLYNKAIQGFSENVNGMGWFQATHGLQSLGPWVSCFPLILRYERNPTCRSAIPDTVTQGFIHARPSKPPRPTLYPAHLSSVAFAYSVGTFKRWEMGM